MEQLAETVGLWKACRALDVPRSSLYRKRQVTTPQAPHAPTISPRALQPAEKAEVRQVLNSKRFADQPPREVYATLLDEGKYLCSWRTMYRILDENQEVRERRNQLRHPQYTKPELLATQPNQLWSWDTPALAPQVQVSPSCSDRPSGPITISTTSWMSSAATRSVGSSPNAKQPTWRRS